MSAFDHINLSREPDYVIRKWLTVSNAIKAALRVISLPDTCPGKSPLPTGTAFLTTDPGWRRFALSDVGCGMCVVRTKYTAADVNRQAFRVLWDDLCGDLAERRNKGLGARVVELRYFGGLTDEEAAGALGVSRSTVQTDWRVARAWLRRALES